jgi:serine/threonine protein kinase
VHGVVSLGVGSVFAGDYRVVEPLAAGGMGAVYVVDQLSTSKKRALKVMHPELVADPELRRRFEQEAQLGSRIESEHVVDVHAAGVDTASGMPWLVMELLRGEHLGKLIEKRGALPLADARAIFEQLCHALVAAHGARIVHRDLKPENIFIAQSRRSGTPVLVKVLDFGIAKLSEEAGTRSTAAMGSPMWMAPEQTTRAPITPAADVWALALVAYYALTGRFFWKSARPGASMAELLREIVVDPIPPPSTRAAASGTTALPHGFDAWFERCLVRDPAKRTANATEAWRGLQQLLSGGAAAPAPALGMRGRWRPPASTTLRPSSGSRSPRRSRRRGAPTARLRTSDR